MSLYRSRFFLVTVFVCAIGTLEAIEAFAQTPQELNAAQRAKLENASVELRKQLDALVEKGALAGWTDAALFVKGLAWALKYDREFTNADIQLLEKSIRRTQERVAGNGCPALLDRTVAGQQLR